MITCPGDVTVETATGMTTATASWSDPTVTDNSGETITPTRTMGDSSGSSFAIASHTIEYTAEDSAGNSATCSFQVVVLGR